MWACPVGGHGNTFCPRRAAKNGNGNTFCPRRAAKGHEERQRQHLLSAEGRGGPRRTATATPFVPRRATKGHEERQRQHLLSAKGHEGARRTATATPFVHEGPRRAAENGNGNTFCPRKATKGRGERQRQHLLSTEGREEHLYWSTWGRENTFLVHIGLRRTLFGPLRTPFLIGEGHFLLPFLGRAGSLSMLTGEGTHKGCPYGWITTALTGERAPTRGAPTGG